MYNQYNKKYSTEEERKAAHRRRDKKYRDQYIKDNLIYHNNELPSISFMNVINNLIKKNPRVS